MPSFARSGIIVFTLLALYPFLADLLYPFTLFVKNHPRFLKTADAFSRREIKWQEELRNCEDVVLDEANGVAIFSCDPGRDKWNTVMGMFISATDVTGTLYSYNYVDDSLKEGAPRALHIEGLEPTKAATFHPLGIGFWPETRTLYSINHGEHPPGIEVFTVNNDASKLTYKRTVTHPLMNTPNSVLPISDHELYVTNDHHYEVRYNRILATLETYLKIADGSVVYLNLKTNEAKTVAKLNFPNGVARLNSTHLAVASTTRLSIFVYEIQPDRSLEQRQKIHCDFWVDNLKTDANGKLLITGHPHAPLLQQVAKSQDKYRWDGTSTGVLDPEEREKAPSWVAEWDGNAEGKLKNLYVSNEFGTSTSTVRDVKRNVGFVSGLYSRGILQFEE